MIKKKKPAVKEKALECPPLPYNVEISSAANDGYIVRVGCKTFAFTTPSGLLQALSDYLENPQAAINAHYEYVSRVGQSMAGAENAVLREPQGIPAMAVRDTAVPQVDLGIRLNH